MSFVAFRSALRSRPPKFISSRAYCPSRPYSWKQRIWYRPDGTPRSKLKGGIYVSVVSTALLLYQGALIFQVQSDSLLFITKLQQVDSKYPIDESSTLSDVVSYILALGDIISLHYPDIGPEYMALVAEVHQTVSQTSPEHNENVRKIFEDLHKIFARNAGDQPFTEETVVDVLETFDKFRQEIWKMEVIRAGQEGGNSEGRKSDDGGTHEGN